MSVLVAFTPRPEGWAALDAGLEEAIRRGWPLLVVNAISGDSLADPALALPADLARVRELVGAHPVAMEVEQVQGVDPAAHLVSRAESTGTRLLVIGLRHRTPVGKLLLGSVEQRVLLDAACPVLAVKAAA
jgi:nucleotide-binding universal stress UspA family protein